jgi:hypothetical protein
MRGGPRHKNRELRAQSALLDAIWTRLGGVTQVAYLLKLHPQTPANWRNRGRVPLMECLAVGSELQIEAWGLNYKELKSFFAHTLSAKKIPSWTETVKSYGLTQEKVKEILALGEP